MAEQSKLKELFEERDRAVKDATRQIFQYLEHVTGAVQRYLELDSTQSQLSWENVALTDEVYPDHGGMLILIGSVFYLGEPINLIRIGVPLDKAVEGTQEDIVQFLEDNARHQDDLNETEQQLMDQMSDTVDGPIGELDPSDSDEQQEQDSARSWTQSFDVDQLTPEQQRQLRLYTLSSDTNDKQSTN